MRRFPQNRLSFFSVVLFISGFNVFGSSEEVETTKGKEMLKRIPLETMESFVKTRSGDQFRLVKGKDILVPADADIFFNLNTKKKILSIQALQAGEGIEVLKTFALVKKLSPSPKPDVKPGSELSLVLKEHFISVYLKGLALQPGRIGDVIRVRVKRLAKNFQVRILNQKEGEILL